MSETIIVALISGSVSLFASVLAFLQVSKRQSIEFEKSMAVMQADIAAMKEDIKSHNSYAKMFSENIPAIKQHMEDVDRRLGDLERRAQ